MARWQDYILRGTRAAQPTGSLVTIGTLYCVTDEDDIIERWSGSVWESYAPTGAAILPIDLAGGASEVINRLPYANVTAATVASRLLGRGSLGAGDWQEISLGGNLSMTGTVLDAVSGGNTVRATNGFRLTLATGQPIYSPQPATPSATDTTNEIVTFAIDPGWYDGTIVTPAATGGNLTLGTRYYLHRITSVTYSFHTTVADAMSGASRVNLTASITAQINPSGISATGLYFTPYLANQIALYDGYDWVYVDLAELSVGLGTLSANTNYDVFLDYNGGVPVLSLGTAWSSNSVRAIALARQDGVWVSSADAQSRYIGTIRTDSTTTTIDDRGGIASQVGGKRFVWNYQNQQEAALAVIDTTDTWVYSTATVRQVQAVATNQVEFLVGLDSGPVSAFTQSACSSSSANAGCFTGSGLNQTTVFDGVNNGSAFGAATFNQQSVSSAFVGRSALLGFNFVAWLEAGNGNATVTMQGDGGVAPLRQSGLNAHVWC